MTKRLDDSVTALPREFRLIRLELAREPVHPHGDRATGYTILAPLHDNGMIDVDAWKAHRERCRITRFRPGEDTDVGHLVRKGNGWMFHYDVKGSESDEVGYHFGDERFVSGEYVSIRSEDGMHPYRVMSVERP